MRRAVIVIADGLRRDLISAQDTPHLVDFAREAEQFPHHRSVFPSCTRTAAASLATGCHPGRHELQGNSVALVENGQLMPRDVGDPDFLQHKRRVTGRSLAVPTLAERLRHAGEAIVFSNVSPGAAYAHDPDGYGHVYHRAGSFGPGRAPAADPLTITPDMAGDRHMSERFVSEVLWDRRPILAVLWLGEPDHTQHECPLGSPEHRASLLAADENAGKVIETVAALRKEGDDVLLLVGSDHGHQTTSGIVDVDAELIAAGLKAGHGSGDVMAIANGTAVLIYVHPDHAVALPAIRGFLETCAWAEKIFGPHDLDLVGQAPTSGLAFAVSLRASEECNAFGIAGSALAAKPVLGKPERLGCGQHGGLGVYEQAPFLYVAGAGFEAGKVGDRPSSILDIAPTVLTHLGLPCFGLDGHPLQRAAGTGSRV
jgi:arylsulfatase A-like enzyme